MEKKKQINIELTEEMIEKLKQLKKDGYSRDGVIEVALELLFEKRSFRKLLNKRLAAL